MTAGTRVDDQLAGWASYWYDDSPQGNAPYGKYFSKSWTGIDSTSLTSVPRPYLKRVYHYIDNKGKVRKRGYRVYLVDKLPRRHSEPHPYSAEIRTFESGADFTLFRGIGGFWSRVEEGPLPSGGVWPPAVNYRPPAPVFGANDQIKLIGRLKEKVRGSDFNLAVTLGESKEALRMIGDSAIRIARGVNFARKGNFVAAIQAMSHSAQNARKNVSLLPKRLNVTNVRRQTADQLSSNWLELQYGWLPLLSDIQSGAQFVAHHLNVPRKKRYTASLRLNNGDPAAGAYFVGAEHYAFTSRRIVAYVSEQPDSVPRLSGLLDPELVAWELTPFSFVADWFAPFGDYLDARSFAKALSGTFVQTTFSVENASGGLAGHTFEYSPGHDAFGQVIKNDSLTDRLVRIERTVSTSLDVPSPALVPLSKALSWKHCTNALALLSQVLKTGLAWQAPRAPR